MRITLFGIIWMLLLLYAFFSNSKKMIFLTVFSAVLQCNSVFVIGDDNGVGPMIVTSIFFIIWYIYKNFKNYLIMRDKTQIITMIFFVSIILSIVLNGQDMFGDKFLYILQILIYMITFLFMRKVANQDNVEIGKIFLPILYFVLIMGIFQSLVTFKILPRLKIVTELFYNETWSVSTAYHSSSLKRLFSTFKEASYCATFLVGAFYYVCFNYDKIYKSKFLIIWIVLEILLTLSTTAYVSLVLSGVLFAIFSKKKIIKFLIPLACLALLISIMSGTLQSVVLEKSSTGSAYERNKWNSIALDNFIGSPIFGVGYKTYRASSIILNLLGNMGIIGFVSYILFVWNYIRNILKQYGSTIDIGFAYFLMAVVICQMIACPDIELCVFWMCLYLIGLSDIKKKDNIMKEMAKI